VPPYARGATSQLLALLGDDRPEEPWRDYIDRLDAHGRDAAAVLVLHICLRRAAIRRDLVMLVAALKIAERHRLLDSPACHQAAQLLRRSALASTLSSSERTGELRAALPANGSQANVE
jgi:hypothetical protein